MAYDPTVLNMVSRAPLTGGQQTWTHKSVDAASVVDASGYITDGGDRGMKVGDLVYHQDTDTLLTSCHVVITVSATAPGAVDMGTGTKVGLNTNSD
jgi:hypothetical protein